MKKFLEEFRKFIARGNVIDMAVGVIVGGAFSKIVTSLVNDMVMPIIAKLIGGLNFSDLRIILTPAVGDVAETAIYYGKFIQLIIEFLIIAFTIFLVMRIINKRRESKKAPPAPPKPDPQIELLKEIRDLLKK